MKNKYYETLLKEVNKCLKTEDVPVSAIIVKDGKIISKGINNRNKKYKTINHAEIIAINKANRKLKNCFLYDCDLYVTLKPCEMCKKVINNARIRNVFYLLDKPDNKKEYDKTKYVNDNNKYSGDYQEILSNFFNKMR